MPAGFHHAMWDGTDERGLRVKPGTYFCRLEAPAYSRIAKLIMSD
jgi:flagellar hook assembly protein FlgD